MKTAVFVVEQAQEPISDIHYLCKQVRSRNLISFKFCGSVAERKALYIRPRKLNLQPLNCDRAGIAISLWTATEMPAHRTRQFMCLEARSPLLNSLSLAVQDISLNEGDRTNN
ncbi:hypothetical protein QUA13_17185 [Microcoleus sp. S28C3]|uniref:hypothetical protein n=1 Tax=Microcoleus sp. S28C3 TaxID=3055414 RepID=UPI002FD0A671